MRTLVLGGTAEARELAARLVEAGVDVVTSLAGRVQRPRLPVGAVRIGGFGGADGLAQFLRSAPFDVVVDATHPFAAKISASAATACAEIGLPRLVLRRPGWTFDPAWTAVDDIAAAAAAVRAWPGESVFLTTGRRDLVVFAPDESHRFLIRTVDPPGGPLPPCATVALDRGPYTVDGERDLMQRNSVGLLVTKDSGGEMTAAKLQAARELDVDVVIVRRPPVPPGSVVVDRVQAAVAWVARCGIRS